MMRTMWLLCMYFEIKDQKGINMDNFLKHFNVKNEFIETDDLYSNILNQLGGMEFGND